MGTNVAGPRTPRHFGVRNNAGSTDNGPFIAITMSVNADRHRIFQVLTVAEYMETWLVLPEHDRESHLVVASSPTSFRIECRKQHQADLSITGSFRTYRRSKLLFTWTKQGMIDPGNSVVAIRLYGDFERTTLSLTHSGLGAGVERSWHNEMWKLSLHKLSCLF
jgi:uncharacterized protein YndB with AHSA1/START domain